MGVGEAEKGDADEVAAAAVACSICLEKVARCGDRSTARLQCGHEFHLDCIGSAFNAKGAMQCPNCRKVEKGNWLYANGAPAFPELSMDEWAHDEDLYELSHPEMPFRVQWCPFGRLPRVASSFGDGESTSTNAFQDLLGHHAIHTEHLATSVVAHPCPYVAYLQPRRSSSSSISHVPLESHIDGFAYHQHWNHTHRPADVQNPPPLPLTDLHYHTWEHQSRSYSPTSSHIGSADQASSMTIRTARIDSDGLPRAGSVVHPFLVGHGSGSRAGVASSFAPSVPPYLTAQGSIHENHSSPMMRGTIFSGAQRSRRSRGLPMPVLQPDHPGYYLFHSTSPSGHSPIDAENNGESHFYAWERDQFAPYPLLPVEGESGWWRRPFPQSASTSDSGHRTALLHQTGSDRLSSQGRPESSSYRPVHFARMQSFM